MKFIVENFNYDFTFSLNKAKEYHQWLGNSFTIKLFNNSLDLNNFKNYCPVGSVEFVHKYYKEVYNLILKPLLIPNNFINSYFLKRNFYYIKKENNIVNKNLDFNKNYFIKSSDIVKGFCGVECINNIKDGNYIISDIINIESEYRCFVYKNELVGLQNYSGNFNIFPDIEFINQFINQFSDSAPVSYTVDIGINKNNENFLIELHNFYSCGLYGFNNLKIYPHMLWRWYYNLIYFNKLELNKLLIGDLFKYKNNIYQFRKKSKTQKNMVECCCVPHDNFSILLHNNTLVELIKK